MSAGALSKIDTVGEVAVVLASAPLLQTVVLDRPWIGALVVLAAGLVAGVFVNRAGKGKLAGALAGIGVLVAAAIMLAGTLITTPEAMLRERTERFVAAIAEADPDTLETMLAPRFVIASRGATNLDLGSEWLLSVAGGMDRAIRSNEMSVVEVEMQGDRAARVRFRCRTALTMDGRAVGSTWEVQWQRFEGSGPDAWKAVRLEAQTIMGQDAGRLWIQWGSGYRVLR